MWQIFTAIFRRFWIYEILKIRQTERSLKDIMISVSLDTQVIKEADVEAQIWQICLLKYLTDWNLMRYLKMKFTSHQKYIWTYKH